MEKVRCPICKNWVSWENGPYRPFCSEFCKRKDLGEWATERYRISGAEDSPDKSKNEEE